MSKTTASVNPRSPILVTNLKGETEEIEDVERLEIQDGTLLVYVGESGRLHRMIRGFDNLVVKFD